MIYSPNSQKLHVCALADVAVGAKCTLIDCKLPPAAKLRLYEMGLVPGTTVTPLKRAPLGDPTEIAVRGYTLCLRSSETALFAVALPKPDGDTRHATDKNRRKSHKNKTRNRHEQQNIK